MADEPVTNGNGGVKRDLAVAQALGACIVSIAVLAGLAVWMPPAQWDLVDKVVTGLFVMANTLAGALIMKTKSG